jgi:hypothetical protein
MKFFSFYIFNLNKYFIIDILDIYIQKIDINDVWNFLVGGNKIKKEK